ncbi:MAG: ATP-binding protein [Phycisphaerales bacterium]|nr:ATP-binding protein [Phycisphaerales bacterium]
MVSGPSHRVAAEHLGGVIRAVDLIAAEAERYIEALAAVHDVLNALSPARAYAQVAAASPGSHAAHKASVAATLAAVARCESILESLFKTSDGSATGSCEVFHVAHECCKNHQVRFRNDAPTGGARVSICAEVLDRALSNLIQNAIRASSAAGTEVVVRVSETFAEVHIVDSGKNNFEPIAQQTREPGGEDRTKRGAGIGLWKAYQLIRASGGELTAEHVSPRGTRMVVHLPLLA